ncbi:MAG TPA: Slp family lipoprotein [Nitrospirota bacterium]|nr:Slp family lipoprotein [Nitrospirota bacterium]
MKKIFLKAAVLLALFSCAPVLDRKLMGEGVRNVPLSQLRETPDAYKGKLFILGGLIVGTRFTEKGSEIEAVNVPVDSRGYLEETEHPMGRFIAIFPKERGFLDPLVYEKGRKITFAGEFLEIRKGKIDEMDYAYPVFKIEQIHLWEREEYYSPGYPYYYPYPYWWYDPWLRTHPYLYWPPPPERHEAFTALRSASCDSGISGLQAGEILVSPKMILLH